MKIIVINIMAVVCIFFRSNSNRERPREDTHVKEVLAAIRSFQLTRTYARSSSPRQATKEMLYSSTYYRITSEVSQTA